MDQPLRILAIVNLPWDPRLGAARVWIELTEEWRSAGNVVEKFCLTDAFPEAGLVARDRGISPSPVSLPRRQVRSTKRRSLRRDRCARRHTAVSKESLSFRGLLVARSVGLYRLYEKFEREAAKRWPPSAKGKLIGRPFYWFFAGGRALHQKRPFAIATS